MCGRGRFTLDQEAVANAVGGARISRNASEDGPGSHGADDHHELARENFSPGMRCWIAVPEENGTAAIKSARWGLIRNTFKGSVSASSFFKMFNARSDNLEKVHPNLIGKKHCVVVYDGFYEWHKDVDAVTRKRTSQPYYIYNKDAKSPICFAGLFDEFMQDKEIIRTFTIITVEAGKRFQWMHDRLPAILPDKGVVKKWLAATDWNDDIKTCLCSQDEMISWHPVTKEIGRASYQDPCSSKAIKLAPPPLRITDIFAKVQSRKRHSENSTSAIDITRTVKMEKKENS